MKKIITEKPQSVIENMHNCVFVKNKEVYVRLEDEEMSLVDYIRKIDKKLYGIEHDDSYCNAEEFGEFMDQDRFTCTMYYALVGFAEVREKLKYYEEKLGEVTLEEIIETIARNCVAWDTSKDKREGLLPEVAVFKNPYLYKKLTGERYNKFDAIKRFNI